jgi:isoleucyl-tRNA synthetase
MNMTVDYGKTIHLPKTDFPRRAGLAQKEPEILHRWEKMGLYEKQRAKAKGQEKFILHMGPPFANGNIHLGHVLSTVLKDVVCRSYQQLGYDAPLVPGFDCHGLPIEWKIEEKYRAASKNIKKEDIDPATFRAECRAFAASWIATQTQELSRIGILADFKNPYTTMDKRSEAAITKEIHKFLRADSLYRGSKPVMWSIPEQTALAEAEVEYREHTSDVAWVKFPIKSGPAVLAGASVVIWTTTPWTLPANRALAYGADLDYVRVTVSTVAEGSLSKPGDQYFVCKALVDSFKASAKITDLVEGQSFKGSDFAGVICHHPLHGKGYEYDVPMLAGDFVTTEAGTGFVHIAGGHGEDDYRLILDHNKNNPENIIEIPHTVQGDGKYFEHVPLFAGAAVYWPDGKKGPANKLVTEAIAQSGNLVAKIFAGEKGEYRHSYPHSWRSKAPVIFRNTPQWFFSMEKNDLRKKALKAIDATRWVPESARNRIFAMVEKRGDWCVSRQRIWGTPIALFVDKKTGLPLRDEKVLARTIAFFEQEGADAWWARPAADFLGSDHDPEDFEQVKDTIDVWFDSGSTQGFVLEERPELRRPADLYLEGSDQHRGWFQSSLFVGCGTRGDAPYKAVLTHGFILDEKGLKMSKSTGNVTSPMKLSETHGADILRLWVAGSDYTADIKFGENILQGHVDVYRRIRGTFCYLLGSLDGSARVEHADLSGLDRFILHRLSEIDAEVRSCIADFDFQRLLAVLHSFCARELSALYFDVCKDTLYCEAKDSLKRRGVVTVLDHVFNHLVHWISPFLAFTAEEAWLSYKGLGMDDMSESIHLSSMPSVPAVWKDDALAATFEKVIAARAVVTGALEVRRAAKDIGASLEAAPKIHIADTALAQVLKSIPFADICITSGVEIAEGTIPSDAFTLPDASGVGVMFRKAEGQKCARCWKYTQDVGGDPQHLEVCTRCAGVVRHEQASVAA